MFGHTTFLAKIFRAQHCCFGQNFASILWPNPPTPHHIIMWWWWPNPITTVGTHLRRTKLISAGLHILLNTYIWPSGRGRVRHNYMKFCAQFWTLYKICDFKVFFGNLLFDNPKINKLYFIKIGPNWQTLIWGHCQ